MQSVMARNFPCTPGVPGSSGAQRGVQPASRDVRDPARPAQPHPANRLEGIQDMPRLRLAILVIAAAGALVAPPATPVASATEACVTDPEGDAGGWNNEAETARTARADILEVCAAYTAAELTFTLAVADPVDPTEDPSWTGGVTPAEIHFQVDVDGDGAYDETFLYRAPGGALQVTAQECAGTGRYDHGRYIAVVDPSCIGDPATLRIAALVNYPDEPSAPVPVWYDFTELSDPVSRTSSDRATARLAGPTRIETAVAISQHQFPEGAPVVYLASASRMVDAVTGGVLTDGPVLLVPPCGALPTVVAAEIRRLNPETITALGGRAAVCEDVLVAAARA